MSRYLRIAARVAAPADPAEATPIDSDKVDDVLRELKRQLDLIAQAASRDNPRRAMKLLEGSYSALEALLKLITRGHDEVEDRREMVEDKIDQASKSMRPLKTQIH